MWLLVSGSAPGWETICSQAGRQILAAETWLQHFGSPPAQETHSTAPLPAPKYNTFHFLQYLQPTPSFFCLFLGFFFLLETHHILKQNQKPIVSKTCLFSARSVYRAPVSSQPSLLTEKPETRWEVIFQSTETGAPEISADAKMSHCSPKERITLEALVLRSRVGWLSDGGQTNHGSPTAPRSPPHHWKPWQKPGEQWETPHWGARCSRDVQKPAQGGFLPGSG